MKISTVILNYNGWRNSLECIESIKKSQKKIKDSEIIVVDNKSTDGSQKKLSEVKNIKLIFNNENLGYSGGNNVGIKEALKSLPDYILVINNDTYVDERFFKVIGECDNLDDIVSPKIFFAPHHEFHTEKYSNKELGKVIWYAAGKIDWENILGVHIGVDEVDRGQFKNVHETDFATGACMLVKREVFEKIGFFDERYFLYLEDMDFCVRAKKAGFGISFLPEAVIWHKNAASSGGSGSKLQDYYITRNRLLFAFKFARLRTKLAVLKQAISQSNNPVKRNALIDFLSFRFGQNRRDLQV